MIQKHELNTSFTLVSNRLRQSYNQSVPSPNESCVILQYKEGHGTNAIRYLPNRRPSRPTASIAIRRFDGGGNGWKDGGRLTNRPSIGFWRVTHPSGRTPPVSFRPSTRGRNGIRLRPLLPTNI